MSSDPKPVGGQWHKAARGELSPPKGASEETLVPQLFTASVPDPRTVQLSVVLGRNLDNLNLDMCMELLEQTPRGQRAAQLGPGGRQDGSRPLRHEHRARQRLGRLCRGARSNSAPPRSPSLSTYPPRSRSPVGSPKADFPELRSAPLVECRRPQLCFVPLQSIEAHLSTISAPPSRRPERCRCRAR